MNSYANRSGKQSPKKPFHPAEIQLLEFNMDDMMADSTLYDPFFGEDDPLAAGKGQNEELCNTKKD